MQISVLVVERREQTLPHGLSYITMEILVLTLCVWRRLINEA